MISILIPTYNYDVLELVRALGKQAAGLDLPYEIRVYDDASTLPMQGNLGIAEVANSHYETMPNNMGRTALRQLLAEDAQFPNLLFIDADMMPAHTSFLANFVGHLDQEFDLIFGGIEYESQKPSGDRMLRWKYGMKRERRSVAIREKIPYLSIVSGCFLIRKELFLQVNSHLDNQYGLDVLFTTELKRKNAKVLHINNPMLHLGLETNEEFVRKTEAGIRTLHELTIHGKIPGDFRPLQRMYKRLKSWGLHGIFCGLLKPWKGVFLRKSLSQNPSLFCFNLYRLLFYCELQKKT